MQRQPQIILKKRLHWQLILLIPLLTMGIFSGCWRLRPLTLQMGETIKGTLAVDSSGPFHIGDVIPLTLKVEAKAGVTYQLPDLTGPAAGGLELKEQTATPVEKLSGGSRQAVHYQLTGWQVGQYTLPGPVVTFKNPTNAQGTLQLAPVKIELVSILPKGKAAAELLTLDIKGIKNPVGLPPRYWLLKWFLLGASVLVLLLLLLWLYRQFLLKPAAINKLPPREPAHVIARRRLEYLKGTPFLAQGDFKTFYSELSECIREYMENRYLIRALEMTTEEFLTRLTTGVYLNQENQSVLKSFLQQSDLVKFAKEAPSMPEAEQALTNIEQLVEATRELPGPEDILPPVSKTAGNNVLGAPE